MNLFDKDYKNLSKEEMAVYELYESYRPTGIQSLFKGFDERQKRREILRENPWIGNYESIFPQNYLGIGDLVVNKIKYIAQLQKFEKLLDDKEITERDILNYITSERAFFIIGSMLQRTNYGHHDRYIFKEVGLPPNFVADFLLIGKNSLGFHFLFVELENPYGDIALKDGHFGNTIRKGLNQIEDWQCWMEKNLSSLRNVLEKMKSQFKDLPKEFFEYDSTRFNYAIVAGRREHYSERTNQKRREHLQRGIRILHYDNLIDESKRLLQGGHY